MEEFLNNLYSNTSVPIVSALILGLLTAISPCPMATNITAIGFISKDIGNKNRVFYNGLIYTLGRTLSYTLLAIVLFLGADQFRISDVFQQYGGKIIGPLLLVIGIFMLSIIKINFPAFNRFSERFQNRSTYNYWDVFMLGVIFALATGIPVILFAWIIAYTISGVGGFYRKIKAFEYWFRRLVAILFIGIGIYYIVTVWF